MCLEDVTKPVKTQDILDTIHRFDDSKKIMSASFFVNFYRRLTMCVGDTSNLLKTSAPSADDGCAEYAVCMKVIRYAKLWKVT